MCIYKDRSSIGHALIFFFGPVSYLILLVHLKIDCIKMLFFFTVVLKKEGPFLHNCTVFFAIELIVILSLTYNKDMGPANRCLRDTG